MKNTEVEKKLRILIVFLFFLYVFISFIKPVLDPDTTWHLKTGEYIFLNKTIPTSDPFSFADDPIPFIGKFILTQYWLSQILFFLIYKIYGPFGLVVTGATIFTSIIVLLWYLIRNKGFYVSLFITGGFTFNVLRDFSAIRPQIFTFLFATIVIFLIEKYKEKKSINYLLPMPFLMILWANMHGGFIYGIVLILIYILSEGIKYYTCNKSSMKPPEPLSSKQLYYLVFFCIISILVSLINPNTYKAFLYAFTTHSRSLFYFVEEYQSPYKIMKINPSKVIYSFWFYLFIAMVMMIIFIKRRAFNPLFLLLFSIAPALISIRYIPLFSIVAAATFRYIPIGSKPEMALKMRYGINILIIIFFSLLIFGSNPFRDENIYRFNDSAFYPVSASNFLIKNKLFGNIFSSYNKSAFLIFRTFPESRVYADSRYISEHRIKISSIIEGEFDSIREQLENINRLIPAAIGSVNITSVDNEKYKPEDDMIRDKSWKDLLEDMNAEIIVHEAVNLYSGNIYPLIFKLIQEDTWKLIYSDGNVLIFVRDIPKFKDIIIRYNQPKSSIYDEIISEGIKGVGKNNPGYYSSIALALLLKGISDDTTSLFIKKALSLDPNNITANYCQALYLLMNQKKIK
ncbi:MAG: hypothetical protein AB1480_07250 [Nitrospirota bacterium]